MTVLTNHSSSTYQPGQESVAADEKHDPEQSLLLPRHKKQIESVDCVELPSNVLISMQACVIAVGFPDPHFVLLLYYCCNSINKLFLILSP